MLPRSMFSAAVLSALLPLPAFADEAIDGTAKLDTVLVTGTRAKNRTLLDSPVPVDVLTAEDLKAAGVVGGELGQALQTLLPSFNFPRQSNSGSADHVRAAQLRGLSPDQVLVLVNGKRRHTSALVADSSKIGRGTAPVDFNAIPISAIKRIEVLRDGAGAQYGSDAIAGVINIILDDADQGGELSTTYGAYHTHQRAIGKTTTDGQTSTTSAKLGTRLGEAGGFASFGTEYDDRNPTNRAGYDNSSWNAGNPAIGQRNYAMGDGRSRNLATWLNSELPLAGGTAYLFGTYSERDSSGANFFRYDYEYPERYPAGFLPQTLARIQDTSLTAGFRGALGAGWDYDSSLTHGRNRVDSGVRRTLNPDLADSGSRFDRGEYALAQTVANLDLTHDVHVLERDFLFAVGGEYRHEGFNSDAGERGSWFGTGAVGGNGLRPDDEARLQRDVFGLYLDVSGDLTDRLFVDAAARFERYSDAGSKLTGKLSGRYRLTDRVALRGALSNNFRAPSLAQKGYQSTTSNYDDNQNLVDVRTLSVDNPIARALGAQDLRPETSTNASLGLTFQANERFDFSLDVYRIDIKDRITLSEQFGSDALETWIADNFGVTGVHDLTFFTNAVDTSTKGAELVGNYRQPLLGGNLTLTTAYSYSRTRVVNTAATPTQLAALGIGSDVLVGTAERNTLTDAAPSQRFIFSSRWADERWSLLGRLTRHGKTKRVFAFAEQSYGARWQLDAEVEYRLTKQFALALGGYNLLDKYPERSNADINYGGNLPYDVLSPIGSNGAYYYTRATYTF
ncbi:iron complex outermembrane receptor protein [Pseudomonas psychrotolerans]|nr:iron complex outermembrane receptor protein [Pseudomonas psychrotolerans]